MYRYFIRYYFIVVVVLLIDQWTKWLVVSKMELSQSIPIIDNFLYITSHRNRGAAWGILQNQMIFFYIVTVIVVIGIIYYLHKHVKNQLLLGISLSLILGGAVGNFIDRLFRKEVVDFIDVMIFTYDYPIFNVADSALFIGVVIIIILTIFTGNKKESES